MIRRLELTPCAGLVALALLLTLGAPPFALAGNEGMYSTTTLGSAVRAWQRNDHRTALSKAREALREPISRRERVVALNLLCVGHAEIGRADRALPYCDRAVKAGTDRQWRQLSNRAFVKMKLEDWSGAAEDYRASLVAYDALSEAKRTRIAASADAVTRETVETNLRLAMSRLEAPASGVAGTTPEAPSAESPAAAAETSTTEVAEGDALEAQPAPPAAPAP